MEDPAGEDKVTGVADALGAAGAAGLVVLQLYVVGLLLAEFGATPALPVVLLAGGLCLVVSGWRSAVPTGLLLPDPLILAMTIAALRSALPEGPIGALLVLTLALGVVAYFGASLPSVHRLLDLVPLPLFAGLMGALGMVGVGAGIAMAGGAHIDAAFFTDPRRVLAGIVALFVALVLHGTTGRRRSALPVAAILAAVGVLSVGLQGSLRPEVPGGVWTILPFLGEWPGAAAAPLVPTMAALALLGVLVTRVAVRDLETETGVDADLTRETTLAGWAALGALLIAAVPVSLAPDGGRDLAGPRGAARRRVVAAGVAIAGLGGLAFVIPPPVLPPVIAGAYLVLLGIRLIDVWIVRTAKRASPVERMTLFGVLGTILILGPGFGLVIGNVAGAAAFALAYSRARPVRSRFTGRTVLSTVDRSPEETALLKGTGDGRVVLTVRGFLFFGTADQLLGDVRAELEHGRERLTHLVLDLGEVDGADSSAVVTFHRLIAEVAAARVKLMVAQMAPDLRARLMPDDSGIVEAGTVDEALDLAERETLKAHLLLDAPVAGFSDVLRQTHADDAPSILSAFEERRIAAGETIMAQGDRSEDLAFLDEGSASVYVALPAGGRVRVRRFGAGTMMGEMGFHLQTPRTASVVADEPCRLLFLSRQRLEALESEDPKAAITFHTLITQRLCRRILDKDHLVANLMTVSRR